MKRITKVKRVLAARMNKKWGLTVVRGKFHQPISAKHKY